MDIRNFSMFEADKKEKKEDPVEQEILKMLSKQPKVKSRGNVESKEVNFPDEKGLYSRAGIKTYLEDKFTNLKIDVGIDKAANNDNIKTIRVKNYEYNETYPYYYDNDKISSDEVKKIKKQYEDWSKEQAADSIEKRKELKEKSIKASKKKKRKPVSEETKKKRAEALKKAREAKKKKNESIITFSEMYINEELENELPKGKDGAEKTNIPKIDNKGLPIANKIKDISIILDDVDKKILTTLQDKGVTMSTYKISDCCGVDVQNVHNVLESLESKEKVSRTTIGTDNYWTLK
jgi:hypothetical protein